MCSFVWLLVFCSFPASWTPSDGACWQSWVTQHIHITWSKSSAAKTWHARDGNSMAFFSFIFFFFTFKSIIPWGLRNQRVGHFFFQRAWLTYYDDVALIRHYRIMRRACDPWKRHQDAQKRFKSAPPYGMRRQKPVNMKKKWHRDHQK